MIPILRTFPTAPEKENTRDDGPRLSIRKALRDGAWHCHKGLYKVPSRHGKIALRSAQNMELLAYLRANGFKTFIVSGGSVEFMRVSPTRATPFRLSRSSAAAAN